MVRGGRERDSYLLLYDENPRSKTKVNLADQLRRRYESTLYVSVRAIQRAVVSWRLALTLSCERPQGITEPLRMVSVMGPAISPLAAATL